MKPIIEFQCVTGGAKPLYACGRCRMLGSVIDRDHDREATEKCCLCVACETRPKERYWTMCAIAFDFQHEIAVTLETISIANDVGGFLRRHPTGYAEAVCQCSYRGIGEEREVLRAAIEHLAAARGTAVDEGSER